MLRTDPYAAGKKRSRRCLNPECGFRFATAETPLETGSGASTPTDATYDRMINSLKDGRGYDREALAAALTTDRRRARISRDQRRARAIEDYEIDEDAPARLSPAQLDRLLGR